MWHWVKEGDANVLTLCLGGGLLTLRVFRSPQSAAYHASINGQRLETPDGQAICWVDDCSAQEGALEFAQVMLRVADAQISAQRAAK